MTAIDSDVFKAFPGAYLGDGFPPGADFGGNFDVGEPVCAKLPNSDGLFSRHATPMAPLLRHVEHVVGMRSEEQVVWIDAYAIVASVQYPLSFWNRTVCDLPRNPMGRVSPVLDAEGAVPIRFEHGFGPLPAGFGLSDLGQESASQGAMSGAVIFGDSVKFSPAARAGEFDDCRSIAHKYTGILT